jgi:glycosyltransferase involved in cell wall biosynthesis
MLEAMARGLPCLATPVGGVPELLPPEALVPRDAGLLASAIRAVASDAALRERMSSRNLRRARDFHDDELQPRRERFHEHLVNATASWGASRMRAAPAT